MRLAIIADIHGNYKALQAVLADIALLGVDRIISLGDNIGYGPEPEEVVQTLLDQEVVSVMGNHELGLVSQRYFNRFNEVARESLVITRSLLSDRSLVWLKGLPAVHVCCGARFVHGCPPQSMTVYLLKPSENRVRRLFSSYPEQICFAGHTHDFGMFQQEGAVVSRRALTAERLQLDLHNRYLLLAGSVGQPRDTLNWHAKYMVWDVAEQTVELRAVPYDVLATIRLLEERHFPLSNARRLLW
jgi:predicted phosphodiesterase